MFYEKTKKKLFIRVLLIYIKKILYCIFGIWVIQKSRDYEQQRRAINSNIVVIDISVQRESSAKLGPNFKLRFDIDSILGQQRRPKCPKSKRSVLIS